MMDIGESRHADVLILVVSGRLDTTTAKAFEDRILARIDSGDRRLVIDLLHLEYVSSSGLRVFLLAAKRLGPERKIAVCSLKGHIRRVFDLVGFSSIVDIYGSRDEAVERI
jgi:anti-sigma B factor antagonist